MTAKLIYGSFLVCVDYFSSTLFHAGSYVSAAPASQRNYHLMSGNDIQVPERNIGRRVSKSRVQGNPWENGFVTVL